MDKYHHVLTPIDIGPMRLKNRFIMGAMHTGLENHDQGPKRLAVFYATRAKADVGLIITGGVSPNKSGRIAPYSIPFNNNEVAMSHRVITDAVHQYDCKIALQILHTGRLAYHNMAVAPSSIQSTIGVQIPRALCDADIKAIVEDYVQCSVFAQAAGYDAVEIMGAEGYLISEFLNPNTNKRTDHWGGSLENRTRLPIEIARRVKVTNPGMALLFRLSVVDFVENGNTFEETCFLANKLESVGVDLMTTGIGWHESKVPTVSSVVPRAAFIHFTQKIKEHISIPISAAVRINTPTTANEIIKKGQADLVCLSRPLLADPNFVQKTKNQQGHLINTCIACNQACLDHYFMNKTSSCILNPEACREYETASSITPKKKKIAVIGAGPSGLIFAIEAAKRGHTIHMFEKTNIIGGQINYACKIPGKQEYAESIRYYREMIKKYNVKLFLNIELEEYLTWLRQFDEIVVATGTVPKIPSILQKNDANYSTYEDILMRDELPENEKIIVLGGGGIGIDVAHYLSAGDTEFYKAWGIDIDYQQPGGLLPQRIRTTRNKLYVIQRSGHEIGANLGITTKWIAEDYIKGSEVEVVRNCTIKNVTSSTIDILHNDVDRKIYANRIVVCAGQKENQVVQHILTERGYSYRVIGGASNASNINLQKAYSDGYNVANSI